MLGFTFNNHRNCAIFVSSVSDKNVDKIFFLLAAFDGNIFDLYNAIFYCGFFFFFRKENSVMLHQWPYGKFHEIHISCNEIFKNKFIETFPNLAIIDVKEHLITTTSFLHVLALAWYTRLNTSFKCLLWLFDHGECHGGARGERSNH